MFKIYNKYILPKSLNRAMGPTKFNGTRSKVVSPANGTVLEIGFGTGYNLPFYKDVTKLYALDPSRELYSYATDRISTVSFPVVYLQNSAEKIPLESGTIDTVVSTWSLCSIPNLPEAMREIKRVLKPGGRFLFVEHGQSSKKINSIAQKLITPVTKIFTGNCHLDRKIDDFIIKSGLTIEQIDMFPEGGRPLMFSYRGVAINK